MTIRDTIVVGNPQDTAEAFRLMLALAKSYTTQIVVEPQVSYLVAADDCQAIRLTPTRTRT